MKSRDVLKILDVSRVSLWTYVKKGYIKVTKMNNGYYDYDDKSVYDFVGKKNRKNIIYARVSTSKQKNDLVTQINYVKKYCADNGIKIDTLYEEVESGITLDRPKFQEMLDEIIGGKIQAVYVSYRDRLSRLSFMILESIFNKFGTRIVVVSNILKKSKIKNNDAELFEDLLSMMHYFTTKAYSARKTSSLYKTI